MDGGAGEFFVDVGERSWEHVRKEHITVFVGRTGDVGTVEELVAVLLNESFDKSLLEEVFIDVEARIDALYRPESCQHLRFNWAKWALQT